MVLGQERAVAVKLQNYAPSLRWGTADPSLRGCAAHRRWDRRVSHGHQGARAVTPGATTALRPACACPLRASDSSGCLHLKDFVKD